MMSSASEAKMKRSLPDGSKQTPKLSFGIDRILADQTCVNASASSKGDDVDIQKGRDNLLFFFT